MINVKEKLVNAQLLKSVYQTLNSSKQTKLVSGTNIKTINGSSLLGSGDITILSTETATDDEITDYVGLLSAVLGKAALGKIRLGG